MGEREGVYLCVCVYVCVRESVRESVSVRVCGRLRIYESLCAYVHLCTVDTLNPLLYCFPD